MQMPAVELDVSQAPAAVVCDAPNYWWKDVIDYNDCWQGLELIVHKMGSHALEMQSGHNGRMALQVNGEVLFWATMLRDHSGI